MSFNFAAYDIADEALVRAVGVARQKPSLILRYYPWSPVMPVAP